MSDRIFHIRRESGHIPSGRQLPRTPPLREVKRHLDFSSEDLAEACEAGSGSPDRSELLRNVDSHNLEPKTDLSDHTMLKGMKGYQLTPSDLDFIRAMQEDKLARKLQGDLEEVEKLLKAETMAAEKSFALRERARAGLDKMPSCADLSLWAMSVLAKTQLPADLDIKSLLSMVKKEDVQRVVEEKEADLAWLEEMVEDKQRKEAEERKQLEKQIAEGQLKLRGLMSDLSRLKSELVQQEEVQKTLQSRIDIKETVEIKAEAGKAEMWERREAKGRVKRGGKERKTVADSKEGAERNQQPRRRVGSTKSNEQRDANEDVNTTAKAKPNTMKRSRQPPTKEEPPQTNPTTKPSGRGRGKPPTVRNPLKKGGGSSSRGQGAAEGGEGAPDVVLRRSKRIASRK